MKFLIMIDDTRQQAKEAFVQMEAQERWLEASRKQKRIDAIFSLAGNHGAVIIVDVPTHEALDELMINMPVACEGANLKIYPLADYQASMKLLSTQFKATLSRMKQAAV